MKKFASLFLFGIIILAISYFIISSSDNYPSNWSRPKSTIISNLTNDSCPDMQGTWKIMSEEKPDGTRHLNDWLVFDMINEKVLRNFDTITLLGDSKKGLKIVLEKPQSRIIEEITEERLQQIGKPYNSQTIQSDFLARMNPSIRTKPPYNSMTDEEYQKDLDNRFPHYKTQLILGPALRGLNYECKNGRLQQLVFNKISSMKDRTAEMGLNNDGDLIRRDSQTYESYFSFWCGDHCDNSIRLPDVTKVWWQRALSSKRIVETPPWKVPFKLVAKTPPLKEEIKILALGEIEEILKAYSNKGILLKGFKGSTQGWYVDVQAINQEELSQFLAYLSQDKKISKVELIEFNSDGNFVSGKIYLR